jgi:integrase
MNTIEDMWSMVLKRSSTPMRQLLPALRTFLSTLDNPHARVLCGQETIEPCNEASAFRLEASVIEHVGTGNISKMNGAEWLKLIFSAIRTLNGSGKNLESTRRPLVSPPEPSPFGPTFGRQYTKVEHWRNALYAWIAGKDARATAEEWLGAICLSAAIHGMLLDSARLHIFISQIAERIPPSHSRNATSVLFTLPFRGLGNHHNIRWYLDPVTEMLVWQYLHQNFSVFDMPAHSMVANFLAANGCEKGKRAQSLRALVNATTAWWKTQTDPVDVYIAGRELDCHSIQNRSFFRLFSSKVEKDAKVQIGELKPRLRSHELQLESDIFQLDDVSLLYPWVADAQNAMELLTVDSVSTEVSELLNSFATDPMAQVYLGWLAYMVRGKSSSGKPLELSTIRRRFQAATPRLLFELGKFDPLHIEISTLEDIYGALLTEPDPSIPILDLGNGLRDFHAYLHDSFNIPLLSNEAEVLGEKIALKPVDANLMSADDYEVALSIIDSDIDILSDKDREVSKIILALTCKGGARRMEAFGLRVSDVQTILGLNILIRPNQLRGLKTKSSMRRLPMHAFLNSRDRRMIVSFHRHRLQQCTRDGYLNHGDEFLFQEFGSDNRQAWIDRIVDHVVRAIRKATKDDLLFIHHLRHSFATWTYLFLRAADLPSLDQYFTHLPFTNAGIRRSRRLRLLLYGRDPKGTRSFAHAISRLLGHSSPRMSFGHYIHSSDFVQAGLVFRLCEQVPSDVLRCSSGLPRSTAFEQIGKSLRSLLESSRHQFAPAELLRPPPAKSGRKPGRPKKEDSKSLSTWISAQRIQNILDLSICHELDVIRIAKRVAVTSAQVEAVLASATRWGPLIGLEVNSKGFLRSTPPPLRGDQVRDFCRTLEASIAALFIRQPELCDKGLQVYLKHYSNDKHDAIFRGEKDAESATLFLNFMSGIGANPADYSWLVRTYEENGNLPTWVTGLPTNWRPQNLRRINPRAKSGAASYAKWAGIFPVSADGATLGKWASITLTLAKISTEIHKISI